MFGVAVLFNQGRYVLIEAKEMIYTSADCDKALKSFADKWAAMVLDQIKKYNVSDIQILQQELQKKQNPHP